MQDAVARPPGGCFVVARWDGRVWSGSDWVTDWPQALQFSTPGSAYEDCMATAALAEQATGFKGFAWYIQRGAGPHLKLGRLPNSLLAKLGAPESAFHTAPATPPAPKAKRGRGGRTRGPGSARGGVT